MGLESRNKCDPEYLYDPVFAEQHQGPQMMDGYGRPLATSDPSPEQIQRMAEAIQNARPRRAVGEDDSPYTMPTCTLADLGLEWQDARL